MKNTKTNNTIELKAKQMNNVAGGTVNKDPKPDNVGWIDQTINGKNYDAIAQYIANILNGDDVRTREVNANVDIYDCEL
jgi:hypothetical protein